MLLTEAKKRLDPRILRTRQLLRQALSELMAEKTFQAITVQDIAERATVNRATFYSHFTDKYALLEHSVRDSFHQVLRRDLPETSRFSSENVQRLIQIVGEFLAAMQGHCPPPHTQYEPLMEKQIKAELKEILGAWRKEKPPGKSSERVDPELVATVASWAIYGAAVQWSEKEDREPAAEFARQVLPLILANLGLDPSSRAR